jgi:tetratricopeptide (TPR) repeat protein
MTTATRNGSKNPLPDFVRCVWIGLGLFAAAPLAIDLCSLARLNALSVATTRALPGLPASARQHAGEINLACSEGSARALFMATRQMLVAGELASAERCFRLATNRGGRDRSCAFALGRAFIERGDRVAALTVLAQAPGSEEALIAEGRRVVARQGWGAAAKWFNAAMVLAPYSPKTVESWGQVQLYGLGEYEAAVASFQLARRLGGDDPYLLAQVAQASQLAGRFDEAERAIEAVGPAGWDIALVQAVRADLRLRRGRTEEALRAAERAVELSPADPWAWQLLGDVRCRRGLLAEATAAWTRASALEPSLGRSATAGCVR